MGFTLTLVYIVLTIVSPDQFGQIIASYHPMVYLAGVTVLASLPRMLTNTHLRSFPQTQLLFGFIIAITLSQASQGRFRGAVESLWTVLPSAAVYFFIVINVTTARRLKIITLITIGTCVAVAGEAFCGYYCGFRGDMFVLLQYGQILRLRAAGFLNDPNDLAQILLIALPLIFIYWKRDRVIANSFVVLAPAVFLLWAIYLTHSRGALIALAVLALVASQKRLGKLPAVVLAGGLIFAMMALDFTGGRGISAVEGADRLEAWATGLELFKSAPLFGIGFGRFTEFNDITAHNSFILCLAELGVVGSTILVALFVTTLMSLNKIVKSQERLHAESDFAGEIDARGQVTLSEWETSSYDLHTTAAVAVANDVEIAVVDSGEYVAPKLWAVFMRLALISFITTSVFLSRSYTITMFLVLGLANATIALEHPAIDVEDSNRWGFFTLVLEALAIIAIYCVVRLRH